MTAKGSAATGKFSAGQVGGSGTVNSYGATYTTGAGQHHPDRVPLTTTEMAGPPEAMEQEAAYYAALPKAATYQVSDTSLTLLDDKGRRW